MAMVAALFIVWAGSASAELKEGLWEITTRADMKGMPGIKMPGTTVRQCITKQDVAPKPQHRQPGQDCKITEQRVVGDTATYAMVCTSKDGSVMETSGKMTFRGNSFNGTTLVKMKGKGHQDMEMTSTTSGKYLGACTK
jgi:hypothetical protein